MKLLLTLTMFMSFSAYATNFGVYLKSADEEKIISDIAEVMELEESKRILDTRVYRLKADESFIKFRLRDARSALDLNRALNNGRVDLLQGKLALWVSTLEHFKTPKFIDNPSALESEKIIVYGYYNIAYPDVKDTHLKVFPLRLSTDRNVRSMRAISDTAPEGADEAAYGDAFTRHNGFLKQLDRVDASGIRGTICDSLYCSCFGAAACLSLKLSCDQFHENSSESESELKCVKERLGVCTAGACRLH